MEKARKVGEVVKKIAKELYQARVERILMPLILLNMDSTGEWMGPALFSALAGLVISGLGRRSLAEGLGSGFGAALLVVIADRRAEILDGDAIEIYFWAGVYLAANVAPHLIGKLLSGIDTLTGE